jgi:intron-binding protein aquarius
MYYRQSEDGGVYFGGWARMAQPIIGFTVVEVARPNIGEKRPARVRADVTVHLNVRREIKNEWENLRKHDACFLVCVQPSNTIGSLFSSMFLGIFLCSLSLQAPK